jgi:hypothetical protein
MVSIFLGSLFVRDAFSFAGNSAPNRIQCSESSAKLIKKAGKDHWVTPREDLVDAKGKGKLQTYWVFLRSENGSGSSAQSSSSKDDDDSPAGSELVNGKEDDAYGQSRMVFDLSTPNNRYQRLINWNVELLCQLLQQIAARRKDMKQQHSQKNATHPIHKVQSGSMALDEVTEIIKLPQFDERDHKTRTRPDSIILDPVVVEQLRDYVTTIASMYRDNGKSNVCMTTLAINTKQKAPNKVSHFSLPFSLSQL